MDGHDLIEGNVHFEIPDPESQSSVGGDVDASYGVVPEPCHGDQVAYGEGDDRAVRSDGEGQEEGGEEGQFEEEEAEFECRGEGGRGEG